MKIHIIINFILFILFFNITYGQNYKFDKIVKNKFSTLSFPNQERNNLFNSKDYSYHMQIYSQNDSLKSSIFDDKNNQIHYFYLDQSDSLKFYYLNTHSYNKHSYDYTYEFSDLKSLKNKKEISLTILSANKKIAKYKLEIQESNENFFPIFNLTAMEPFHLLKIISPSNFTVTNAEGINISGKRIKYELNSIENINLEIKVPEKLSSE